MSPRIPNEDRKPQISEFSFYYPDNGMWWSDLKKYRTIGTYCSSGHWYDKNTCSEFSLSSTCLPVLQFYGVVVVMICLHKYSRKKWWWSSLWLPLYLKMVKTWSKSNSLKDRRGWENTINYSGRQWITLHSSAFEIILMSSLIFCVCLISPFSSPN